MLTAAKAEMNLAVMHEVSLEAKAAMNARPMPEVTSAMRLAVIRARRHKVIAAHRSAVSRIHAARRIAPARQSALTIRINARNKPHAAIIAVQTAIRLRANHKRPSNHAKTTAACACPSS